MVMEEASSLGLHWKQKTPDNIMAEFEHHVSENIAQALHVWTNRVERARNDTKLAKPSELTKPAMSARPAPNFNAVRGCSPACRFSSKKMLERS